MATLVDVSLGIETIERLLVDVYRVDVRKALDPLDPQDYLRIVKRCRDALRRAVQGAEAQALGKALRRLDVDWKRLTDAQRKRVAEAANESLRDVPARVLPQVNSVLRTRWIEVVQGAKRKLFEVNGAQLGVDLKAVDMRVLDYSLRAQSSYFKDEFDQRRDDFSAKARQIVEDGLKRGASRHELGAQLERAMTAASINRSRAYCDVVSSAMMGRARSYGSLAAYEDLEIERYIFEAVLDEVTTPICRFMHGRFFSVERALTLQREVSETGNPEDVKYKMPWVRTGRDDEGNQQLYFKDKEGKRVVIADVVQNAQGTQERGEYKQRLSDIELMAYGVMVPPLHGHCRSRIVADL